MLSTYFLTLMMIMIMIMMSKMIKMMSKMKRWTTCTWSAITCDWYLRRSPCPLVSLPGMSRNVPLAIFLTIFKATRFASLCAHSFLNFATGVLIAWSALFPRHSLTNGFSPEILFSADARGKDVDQNCCRRAEKSNLIDTHLSIACDMGNEILNRNNKQLF